MTETLAGGSPCETEELLVEQPSLAEAAVARADTNNAEIGDHGGSEPSEEEQIARELVRSARSRGVAMTGPGGMLKGPDQDRDRDGLG